MRYRTWLVGCCRLSACGLLGTLGAIAIAPAVLAQPSNIVPDNTLGTNNSIVVPNAGGLRLELIDGGAQRGGNVFHSFQEFNISNGRAAYFNQPQGVINILSRVTGTNPSQILGTLGVVGSANLFFINPNGIIFGPNASLDVGGAFVASTANAIRLGPNGLFSASDPASSNLLNIQPSALFFNALGQPKPIINQSTATSSALGGFLNGNPQRSITGLQVLDGQSLLLVGGPISMPGGKLTAFDGRIEIAAIGGQGNVGLISQGQTLSLSLPANLPRADINFSQEGTAEVSGLGVGNISLYANNFTATGGGGLGSRINVDGDSIITPGLIRVDVTNALTLDGGSGIASTASANSLPGTKATNIVIDAGSVTLTNLGFIGSLSGFTDTDRQYRGDAGDVFIRAREEILLDNGIIFSGVFSNGIGNGGNIFLQGRSLTVQNGGGISAQTDGQGNAGSIKVEVTADITVKNRSLIEAATSTAGKSGSIDLLAGGDISLDGGFIANLIIDSATGSGNDITIEARSLSLDNNGIITSSTLGQGNAGNINLNVGTLSVANDSVIASSTLGQGNAGNVKIGALSDITVANGGKIRSDTQGTGNAGKIDLTAGGNILLLGTGVFGTTGITSEINIAAQGQGNNISINAKSLTLTDAASINASTSGIGDAGNILANVDGDITLTNGSLIQAASVGQGDAGSINLSAGGNIAISGADQTPSGIATFTSNTAVGDGKDITLKARSLALTNNALVAASTFGQGNAGNIKIDVSDGISLVGAGQIQSLSSGRGNAGKIDINAGGDILLNGAGGTNLTGISNTINPNAIGEGQDIVINARSLTLTNGAIVSASTFGQGNAGNIEIDVVGDVALVGAGQIQSLTGGRGNAGKIDINAGNRIRLEGTGRYETTTITNAIIGSAIGEGNNITLQANSLTISNSAIVAASTLGQGSAGNVNINISGDIALSRGGQIQSITGGQGDAGKIDISAGGNILLDGTSAENTTAIGNVIAESGIGEGKDLSINARSLTVTENAFVGASTLGQGSAGNIMINVSDDISLLRGGQIQSFTSGQGNAGKIDLNAGGNILLEGTGTLGTAGVRNTIGSSAIGEGNDITIRGRSLTLTDAAVVNASTFGTGNAGNINIDVTESVSALRGGQILSLTRGNGNAGNIDITAGGQIQLVGIATDGSLSKISTEIGTAGIGDGNGIRLQAQSLSIGNGGLVVTSTSGIGSAGNIDISVDDGISVADGGQIQAATYGQGDAGSISLLAGNRISVDGQDASGSPSLITNLVSETSGGEGADIEIRAESLSLSNGGILGTTTLGQGNAGNIDVQTTNEIFLGGSSGILTSTTGQGDGGSMRLLAGTNVFLGNQSQLTTSTRGQGNAGNLEVQTGNGIFVTGGSLIQAATIGYGDGGNINLQAGGQISLDGNSSQITSAVSPNPDPAAQGQGGNISIQAQSLGLTNGGLVSANTAANGNAGNINISTQNTVALSGDSSIDSSTAGIGNGGIIDLTTRSLSLTDGGQISAAVVRGQDGALGGQGRGGTIRINADQIDISGVSFAGSPSGLFALNQIGTAGSAGDILINANSLTVNEAGVIAAGTNNLAPGGNITINTTNFSALDGGQVVTASQSGGNAGTIQLNATGDLILAGREIDFQQRIVQLQQTQTLTNVQRQQDLGASDRQGLSGLFAGTSPSSTGSSGSIQVNSNQLTLRDGATITVDSRGTGDGGNLNIQTGNLLLNNGASLNAATASGEGGNISLNVGNFLQMRQNSIISAQAQGTGNGGNINISTRFLIAAQNSDIVANAFEGRGGNIQITTQGIFGIQARDFLTPLSDINASSQFGTDGVVQINTTVDPSRELVSLPSLVVDVSGLIAQGCRAETTTASRFVVTGRGGLPTNPGDLLTNEPVLNDLGQPVGMSPSSPEATPPEQKSQAAPPPIVEAQGWVVRPDGKIVLTAQTAVAQPIWFKTPACEGN
ncbi:MAG: filamentous hemagglutinin N-terminal domain-containing protein [Aphanocapsa sp. GSE-SYN-MK-11-07L]|jgi:filamentous hemagglutinin family protein|nr:filamentous hemagglutinin N-terminal domain-containing protein [Aphanocapsa sp. GSE-SYN-MK-11-07L]